MESVRAQARRFADLGPADGDHLHALRVAIGLVVPGAALLLAGRPELIIYAVFGSFTGMYGRAEPHWLRLTHQTQAAVLLLLGAGLGVLISATQAPAWVLVLTTTAFATVGSLYSDRFGLRPEGPFFGIFGLGAMATVPADLVNPWTAIAICASTAVFCLFISLVLAVRSRTGRPAPMRGVRKERQGQIRGSVVHAACYAVAISTAGTVGTLLGVHHANWAMAGAAVPLAASDARRSMHSVLDRGVHRVIGTLAGLVVTELILLPGFSDTALAIVVMLLLFPTELFMSRHYGLALWFFTPLILLMTDLADPMDPWTLVTARAADTLIGVAAGVAAALAIRRLVVMRARRRRRTGDVGIADLR